MELVPESISFPAAEEQTLRYWTEVDAFLTSGRRHEGLPEFSFYDGPPFATGTPHYGHILAGTIKDTVTRYAHMNGHHVTRRFGYGVRREMEKSEGWKGRVLGDGWRYYSYSVLFFMIDGTLTVFPLNLKLTNFSVSAHANK